jgi:Spy/CpxP family protein refolding chaperone
MNTRPTLRLLVATMAIALAGGLVQTVHAAPFGMGGMGHGAHGGPGMGMMGGGPQIERMLDGVNASAEQKAQIKQIMTGAMSDLRAQREAGRALREQAAQLFTQPSVDARAAETLRQQMLAQHDQASKRMLQAMLDASRVLTPEQRKQIAERMAQRRGMMERHRHERESLEGGRPRS